MRDVISTIAAIGGLIAFIVYIPIAILSLKKKNGKAPKQFGTAAICLVASLVGLYEVGSSPKDESQQTTVTTVDTQAPFETPKVFETSEVLPTSPSDSGMYVFGMSAEEFTEAFNAVVEKYKLDYLHISRLKIDSKTFQYTFNDDLSMVGTIDSNQKLQEVMFIANGGFKEETGGNLMTAIITLIMTTNSNYSYNDAQDVLKDIGLLANDVNLQDFEGATDRNKVKYRFKIQDDNMATFGIKAAK
ncbi:hypothetical protein NST83_06135 [Paenibacillus sp. FSL R10-2782]|uniref:hypothetical protein n=1 Tax=Paenibacillus sp. FSL R10-2782 TaxID=2954661 RepID=UPI003159939D